MSAVRLQASSEALLKAMAGIRRALGLYPWEHPMVQQGAGRFLEALRELQAPSGEVRIGIAGGELLVNGEPMKQPSLAHADLLRALESAGFGELVLESSFDAASLRLLIEAAARCAGRGSLAAELLGAGRGVRGPAPAPAEEPLPAPTAEEAQAAAVARDRWCDSLGELELLIEASCRAATRPAVLLKARAAAIRGRLLDDPLARELMPRLLRLDEPSYQNAVDGAVMAWLVGQRLHLSAATLETLGRAALLRDVGLLDVPAGAVRDRRMGQEARADYELHPGHGARRLLGADPVAAVVAYEHHRGLDGSGYPRSEGTAVPLHALSRIVTVASDFVALSSGYEGPRLRLPAEAIRDLVQGAGSRYDLGAIRALLQLSGFYPEGTAVTLRDGSRAIVTGAGRTSWLAPEVLVLRDPRGQELKPRRVDGDTLGQVDEVLVLRVSAPSAADARGFAVADVEVEHAP